MSEPRRPPSPASLSAKSLVQPDLKGKTAAICCGSGKIYSGFAYERSESSGSGILFRNLVECGEKDCRRVFKAAFRNRIRDILVWIRSQICTVPLPNGDGSGSEILLFSSVTCRTPTKNDFFPKITFVNKQARQPIPSFLAQNRQI